MDPVISSPSLSLSKESHFWYFWQAVAPRMKHLMCLCLCLCVCVYVNGFILHLSWWKKSCTGWDVYIYIYVHVKRYVKMRYSPCRLVYPARCLDHTSQCQVILTEDFPSSISAMSLRSSRLKLCSGSPEVLEVSTKSATQSCPSSRNLWANMYMM